MRNQILDDLRPGARAAVFGVARSGLATITALLERGYEVVASDQRSAEELGALPSHPRLWLDLGGHREAILDGIDLAVVSPGVPLTLPIFDGARARGIPVIAEIELASRLLPGHVIAITGTNGKSTTTALTAAILQAAGLPAIACGNIGKPWISFASEAQKATWRGLGSEPIWVVELSSFQLDGITHFAPHVALHLNLTPDHLDRYHSMDAYGASKARIFENQRVDDRAVLNADDPLVARIRTKSERFEFSRRRPVARGAWFAGDEFLLRLGSGEPRVAASRSDLALTGMHNVENALAAMVAAALTGAPDDAIRAAFRTFQPLPHRTELVRTRGGVGWFDDSKGTNVDATLKSLEGFPDDRVWIILGGKDKGDDFGRLADVVKKKAHRILTIGAAAPAIHGALEPAGLAERILHAETLARAVAEAASQARAGDVVLLSPACASFDQFRNFEHRGEVFKSLVKSLPDSETSASTGSLAS